MTQELFESIIERCNELGSDADKIFYRLLKEYPDLTGVYGAKIEKKLEEQYPDVELPEMTPEEQHQIHFIAGNTCGDLLDAAQLSGEITVNWQAGGLVQHPAGGTGGDDSVPGQDTTVGGAELKCKFFAGIMCKNGNCHNSLSPLY